MIPVILSGGSGTRLWPVSRESYPKQFCEFFDRSFLKETILRLQPFGTPRVLTLQSMKTLTENTYKNLGLSVEHIIYEPMGRNTAPAIALLCHELLSKGLGEEIVGVFPADHLVEKSEVFKKAVAVAEQAARAKKIVTLGVSPSYAATGYGYIELASKKPSSSLKAEEVVSFHEKPSAEKAATYLSAGNFFWNAGIFIFQVKHMVSLFEKHLPSVWQHIQQMKSDRSNLSYLYANIDGISLDYGILEKTKDILCVPCDIGWSDVGSWDEMARLAEGAIKSAQNSKAQVYLQNADNNYVYTETKKIVALTDVSELIVVDTPDALLVAHRGQSQNVSSLVKGLQAEGLIEAANAPTKTASPLEFKSEALSFSAPSNQLDVGGMASALKKLRARQDLGFMKSPVRDADWKAASEYAAQLQKKYKRLVVVGLGGSQLGGQTLVETLVRQNDKKHEVEFWGEIDPAYVAERLSGLKGSELEKTHFVFISKSGKTLELATLLSVISGHFKAEKRNLFEQTTVVTEKKTNPLYTWAKENKIPTLEHPQDVGGRFSVFTMVGLLPAAFAGVDMARLKAGTVWGLEQSQLIELMSAHFSKTFDLGRSMTVFWAYVQSLSTFQKWVEQLWAESLGQALNRQGAPAPKVSTPFIATGVSAQHSVLQQFMEGPKDKSFVFLRYKNAATNFKIDEQLMKEFSYLKGQTCFDVFDAESKAVQKALDSSGAVTSSIELSQLDAYSLGALMIVFQMIIGTLGEYLDINAYDQPGVELGKKLAIERLREQGQGLS